jgi:hypothetical protein
MSKHIVLPHVPPLIDNERFNMNGNVPSAPVMKRLAETFNYVSGKCKKQFFLKSQALFEVATPDPAQVIFRGRFRTGHNTTAVRVVLGLAPTDYAFSTSPYVQLVVKDTVPATVTVTPDKWYLTASTTAAAEPVPDQIYYAHSICTGFAANTEYTFSYEVYGVRVLFASMTECDKHYADDSVTAVCDPGEFVAEGPIYDSHIADLVEANNELWQHNGAHLISWCPNWYDDTWPALTATSYTNVINNSSTTVTAATPGWNLWTQYHNTVNRTTVPVKLCVLVERVSGTGTFDYRLTDGTNTLGATGASGAGEQWLTTTGTVPAQAGTKWDLHAKVSAGSWRIKAVSLYEWES